MTEKNETTQSKYDEALEKYNTSLNDEEVAKQTALLIKKHLAGNDTREARLDLLHCLDLTSLHTEDSEITILPLVKRINQWEEEHPDLGNVAAICVYPIFAEIVRASLEAGQVKLACVTGGFPSSQTFTEVKVAETAMALMEGAEEIDTVFPVGKFLCGDYEALCDELQELKETCKDEHLLKVILETGALRKAANIKKAAILAMYAGADFIKTSTGKEQPAATPEAAYVMCRAIKEYHALTDRRVGFKAAGGIRTIHDALIYYTIVKETLGKEWLKSETFRIGASGLYDTLLKEIL